MFLSARSGLVTSVIGLGGGSSGRFGLTKGGTRADAVRLIRSALDHGITFFDGAGICGGVDELLAEGLADRRRRCRAFDQGPSRPRSVPFFGIAAREPGVVLGCSAARISLHCANHSEAGRADAEGASNGPDRPASPARRHAAPASARGCADPSRAGENEGGGKNSCDRNHRSVPRRSRPRHAAPGGQGRAVRRDHDRVQSRQPERGGGRHSSGDEGRHGRDRNVCACVACSAAASCGASRTMPAHPACRISPIAMRGIRPGWTSSLPGPETPTTCARTSPPSFRRRCPISVLERDCSLKRRARRLVNARR